MIFIAMLTPYLILPAMFLIASIILIFIPKIKLARASLYGLISFFIFVVIGCTTILQSRGSTAGIGFIFLPMLALFPGFIGFLLGKMHTIYSRKKRSNQPVGMQKIALILLSILLVGAFVLEINNLLDVQKQNATHTIKVAAYQKLFRENGQKFKRMLSKNKGRESAFLDELAKGNTDRTFLIPIAASKFSSKELLERLSKTKDLGVVLSVAGNKNSTAKTLKWIQKSSSYPPYFYATLAANESTPSHLLWELYEKRGVNSGIAQGLARNENVPIEMLEKLSGVADRFMLREFLKRSDLTCGQLARIKRTIAGMEDKQRKKLTKRLTKRSTSCLDDR